MSETEPETGQHSVTEICKIDAPYRREIVLQDVMFESGMRLMRVRIREGRARFTILDIDPATATTWGRQMLDWAQKSQAGDGA